MPAAGLVDGASEVFLIPFTVILLIPFQLACWYSNDVEAAAE